VHWQPGDYWPRVVAVFADHEPDLVPLRWYLKARMAWHHLVPGDHLREQFCFVLAQGAHLQILY